MTLEKLTNKNLQTIVQVYQYDFVNKKSSGLGDFLRGSFYLMQLSRILNVGFKIDLSNHPISEYIINNGKSSDINYKNIQFVEGMNRPEISYLMLQSLMYCYYINHLLIYLLNNIPLGIMIYGVL